MNARAPSGGERRPIPGTLGAYTVDLDAGVWSTMSGELRSVRVRPSRGGGRAVELTTTKGKRVRRSPRTLVRLAFPEAAAVLDAEDQAAMRARAAHARATQAARRGEEVGRGR